MEGVARADSETFCVPSVASHSLTAKTRNEPPSVLVLLQDREREKVKINKLLEKTHTHKYLPLYEQALAKHIKCELNGHLISC